MTDKIDIFGVVIDNLTMDGAVDQIVDWMAEPAFSKRVYFVNAHCLNISRRDADYCRVLAGGDLVLADGRGIELAGRMLATPVLDNVNGTDMFPLLCRRMADEGRSLYLYGGRAQDLPELERRIRAEYPGLKVAGRQHGYASPAEAAEMIADINRSEPDLVLAALGCPAQEMWIDQHASALQAKVVIGVGGLFDVYSGRRRRPPRLLREHGLEWTYRMVREPIRLGPRYVRGNPSFLWHVRQQVRREADHHGSLAAR